MKILLLIITGLILIFSLNFTSGCTVTCNEPYIQFESGCCLDENNNNICDDDEKKKTDILEPLEVKCEEQYILSTMCCIKDKNNEKFCDAAIEPIVQLGDIECEEPFIKVTNLCCQDLNNNNLCDHLEEEVKEAEPILTKGTSLPPASYTGSRYVPRTVSQTTPQYETKPSFFWSTPYYSEPAIKGYWVSIDSETEWTLVTPPTGKTWTSKDEIVDGTHNFRIRTEYGDGRFGEAASVYFTISTQLPDIAVGDITLEQTLFRDGNPPLYEIKVSTVIKNDASKDFIGANNLPVTAITIYLHVDGAWRTTANSVQQLFAGEEKQITFSKIYLTEGEHELQVILDQSDTIKEADETNNEKAVMIDVG